MSFRLQARFAQAALEPHHVDKAIEDTLSGLKQNGGSSVHVKGHKVPERGYMVGQGDDKVFSGTPKHSDVKAFVHQHADKLSKPDHFLGSWHDSDSGSTALDVSRHFHNADEAHAHARKSNEKAIYEIHSGESIPTHSDGADYKARM